MSPCHPEPDGTDGLEERLEGDIIIALRRVDADGYLVSLDFLGCTDDCPVTTAVLGAHLFESEIIESLAQFRTVQLLGDVATDNLHRSGYGHELSCLCLRWLSEVEIHKFLFQSRRLKSAVVPVLLFYLLIGEPVAEITLVEGVSLGVDAFVIERMLTG